MERYQVNIAYDGTNFQGFQKQGKGRTVQAEIEKVLRQLGWQGRSILFAGRTDTGVHARGQVIAFDLDWAHGLKPLHKILDHDLPPDIAVQNVKAADVDFQPRFDAVAREYRYRIFFAPERDPLREHAEWRIWPAVDVELLNEAASRLVGVHDFAAFGSPTTKSGSTVRQIFVAEWQRQMDGVQFRVIANAFLYRMVRRLVYTQLRVAMGKLTLDAFTNAVNDPQALPPGLAKPHGLVLEKVYYPVDGLYLNGMKIPGK